MSYPEEGQCKIWFSGEVISIQVRSTVWRYLTDNRTHREIGYNLFLCGDAEGDPQLKDVDEKERAFSVAISEKQMHSLQLHICDTIQGTAWTEMYPENEYADYYRAGALKKVQGGSFIQRGVPPWIGNVPNLETYAWRGARQLDTRCYKGKCFPCMWAAMANVSIEYNWDTGLQKHRFESFCYGPKSCKYYKMGRARAVSCKGMGTAYDDGCLDEIFTENRGEDD